MKKNILFSKTLRNVLQLILIIAPLLLCSSTHAQKVFWTESFENVTTPSSGTRSPKIKPNIGLLSQFHRTDGNTINVRNTNSFASKEGNFYWSGEYGDMKSQEEQEIIWDGINIAGKTGLSFQGLFAAITANNQLERTNGDYIIVEYAIDNETYKSLIGFRPNKYNLLEEYTENKMDDSQSLSNTFTNFSKSILGTGNTLKLRIRVKSNGGFTKWAIDDFKISGANAIQDIDIKGTNTSFTNTTQSSNFANETDFGVARSKTFSLENKAEKEAINLSGKVGPSFSVAQPNAFTFPTASITNVSCNGGNNGAISLAPIESLATSPTSNNTGGGISFDVSLNKQLKITGFDLNLAQNSTVRFYYRVGTAIGNELSSSGWILVEEATLTTAGTNNPTRFNFTNPITLPAGTYGFYFVSYSNIRYLNNTSPIGSVWASNADMTIYGATGRSVIAPGDEFSTIPINTRNFSGRVNYESDVFSFSWSNSATTRSISGLTAGPYTLTITAASDNSSQSQTFNVFQPNAIIVNASSQTNIDCINATGAATVSVSGGSIPYTYAWSGPGTPTGDGTRSVTGLTEGSWTCTVTDNNGCIDTRVFNITSNTTRTASISYAGTPFCKTASPVNVTLTGTTGGAFTSNSANLSINNSTGEITPSTSTAGSYTVTYTIAASGGCAAVTATTSVTINDAPNTTISYPAAAICKSAGTTNITRLGTPSTGGTFSSSSGLILNSSTGRITPGTSTAGSYTVTLSIPASGGCPIYTTTTAITITAEPSATIGYSASSFCTTADVQNVTRNGTSGGTYSAQPSGLTIDTNTGQITPSSSTANNYVVYYTVPASGGCGQYQTTRNVSIGTPASATITYAASGFCSTDGLKNVNRTGTSGGTFTSSPAGLTINSSNGLITPNSSSAGTYTITYSIAASSGCPAFTTTTSVAISTPPSATITYNGSPFCGASTPINVTQTGSTGGIFTATPTGLSINSSTGQITPNSSTAGTYTVSYTISSNCPLFTSTASVTLSSQPSVASNINTSSNSLCGGASVSLTATCASGTITWYNQATGGITLGTGSPFSQTPATTTTYYVSCNNGICESSRVATSQVAVERINIGNATPFSETGENFPSSVAQNFLFLNKVSLTKSTLVDTVSAILSQNITGDSRIRFAVYTDVNNLPTNLVASSAANSSNSTPTLVAGLNKFALDNTVTLDCGNYWIGFVIQAPNREWFLFDFNGSANESKYISLNFDTAFPTSITPASLNSNANYRYNVYLTGNPSCSLNAPSNISVSNTSICTGSNVTLFATCGTGTVQWYNSQTGNTLVGTGTGLSVTPSNNTTYYASCKDGVNESCRIVTNQIVVNTPPSISINGSDNLSCSVTSVNRTATGGGNYSWSNGLGTNATVNISNPGIYTVTVTNTNGCSATATTNVTIDNSVPIANITGTNNLTCATTSVSRTATGGGNYSWSNGLGTNATVNISNPGIYTVTVTNTNGCSATATTNVTIDNSVPIANITGTNNLTCATTSVSRTATGGGNYSWSNGLGTNATVNISNPGIYTVTVTNTNGCSATATTSVTIDNSVPIANITGTNNLTCTTTSVSRTATGGSNYSWSNGLGTNATVNISNPGIYTVTVTNTNGCSATATTSVTIDNSVPIANITGTNNLTCTTTSVSRTATGGSNYSWSNGLGTNATVNISNPGIYTVTVTNTNGCSATATTSVTMNNSVPIANITGTNNLTCTTTSVSRTATGGGNYSWSNGLGTNATVNISNPGIYTVTVTNTNGCSATATTSVTMDNSVPIANITGTNNLTCTTTSVSRTATGGGNYSWSNGLGTNATVNISNPGIYTVTVTNTNGCSATATTSVTIDNSVPIANITGTNNLTCTTTSVSRTATGGGNYSWSNGLGTNATVNISNPGIYTVTVTNTNGCSATATTSVTMNNSVPIANITGTNNLTCATTSVSRTATGGGSYSWSNGLGTNATVNISNPGIYTVTVTNTNGCSATATTSVTIDDSVPIANITGTNNLTCTTTSVSRTATGGGSYSWSNGLGTNATVNISNPGIYTVTVTNTNGCSATATTSVTIDNSVPIANITGTNNLTCATTSVSRTATGGGNYSWSNGLGTNATVNISNPGIYTVTVTNTNGCSATATTNVTIDNSVPIANITGTNNLTCATTSVSRTATGGGNYSWSNGLGTNATVNISNPGIYTVTVTNTNGCSATATTSVTIDNSVPIANITGTNNLTCTTTSVSRTATGGGSYSWSNGLGTNATVNISNPGIYTVTVTNTNGCSATATTSVTIDNSVPIANITGTNNLTCATTSVSRTATGGGNYSWSNGLGTNATVNISNPGIYTVTVTNTNGCSATATTSVTIDNSVPIANITGTNNLTCATTSVSRTATGGGNYSWSNGLGTNATVNISNPGIYTVTVTNTNGCSATATTSVTMDNSVPIANITGTNNLTCTTTSVSRTATGGGNYSWSNGLGTNATVNISNPGIYTVTVTNTNGCSATATTSVTIDNSVPIANITGTNNLTCTTTSVSRTATGGGNYSWSNGLGTNATVNISNPGIYTVTVTNTNGCSATATTSVTMNNSVPIANITGTNNLTCATTSVSRTATGGGSYSWSNGLGTNATVNISNPGIYTVTVTNTNGCSATATTSVSFNNNLAVTASNTGPYNIGQNIQLNATGGSNYLWAGPNNFSSTSVNPTITNSLTVNSGTYTVTATIGACSATATTNVIVSGIDPCSQIVDLQYVKAENPYQPLFSLTNGMTVQQIADPVSILAVPICTTINIESVDMTITGPEQNTTILQNVQPFSVFDNFGLNVFGRNLIPGTYTLTVTGYAQDNRGGGIVYGPTTTTFTIVGNLATISAPILSNNSLCAGSNVDVTFNTTGTFDTNNNFQIQLSDSSGRFINPTIIGTATTAGTISCLIPQMTVESKNYKIRVASSNQVLAGNPAMSLVSVIGANKAFTNDMNGTTTEKASVKITASNKIIAPANVSYQAGKAIELNPGFVANSGTVFKAEIKGCNN